MEQLKPTQLKKLIHLIVKRHKGPPLIIGITGVTLLQENLL